MNFEEAILKQELKNKTHKIFGIGFPKTGNTSLNEALTILGYNSIQHPSAYTHLNLFAVPVFKWNNMCLNAMNSYHGYRSKEREYLYKNWDAITNFGEHIYPILDKNFVSSKFILTIRDKKQWLASVKEHWEIHPILESDDQPLDRTGKPMKSLSRLLEWVHIYHSASYNEEYFSILYDNHIRNVKYYFKDRNHDLLIIDICGGEGWEKLCPFLGKEISSEPFPHKNKTSFRARD